MSQAQIKSVGQKSALEMKQQWQSKKAEEEEKAFSYHDGRKHDG